MTDDKEFKVLTSIAELVAEIGGDMRDFYSIELDVKLIRKGSDHIITDEIKITSDTTLGGHLKRNIKSSHQGGLPYGTF